MKNKVMVFSLVLTSIFFWPVESGGWDDWHTRWTVLYFFCGLGVAYHVYRRFGFGMAWVTFLVCSSSIWTFAWRANHLESQSVGSRVLYNGVSQIHLITYLLLLAPVLWFKVKDFKLVEKVFAYLAAFCAPLSLLFNIGAVKAWMMGTAQGGLFNNPSMAGCFMAVCFPLVWKHLPRTFYFWQIITLVAICNLHTSMPFGVLAVVGCSYMFIVYSKCKLSSWLWGVGLLIVLSFMGYEVNGEYFLSSNGRFGLWGLAMDWWGLNASPWFGYGAGTAFIAVPRAQLEAQWNTGSFFIWMHNEWLQVLFEYGVVGLTSLIVVFVSALYSARNSAVLFSMAAGYGAMALGNYPSRMPVHAALGVWLFFYIFLLTKLKSASKCLP